MIASQCTLETDGALSVRTHPAPTPPSGYATPPSGTDPHAI